MHHGASMMMMMRRLLYRKRVTVSSNSTTQCYYSTFKSPFIDLMNHRGFIYQHTESLNEMIVDGLYLGIDPTFTSLHIGHLIGLMALHYAADKYGIMSISLIGGATASIGDPTGKTIERPQLESKVIQLNTDSLSKQIKNVMKNLNNGTTSKVKILNNLEWFEDLKLLDFLRHVGSHSRVSTMLARDSVQTRLNSNQGMSYHEFSYSLLQAFDFYELKRRYHVNLQLGGSDQWGNMMAGTELIEKKSHDRTSSSPLSSNPAHVFTFPLLTTSSGAKFGKSEGNAIWLDPLLTSPYELYQYFLQTPDTKVEELLKLFTFLELDCIKSILKEHHTNPSLFLAQRTLAEHVTVNIHSQMGLEKAKLATTLIFRSSISDWSAESFLFAFSGSSRICSLPLDELERDTVETILTKANACSSLTTARKLIHSGSVSLNKQILKDPKMRLDLKTALDRKIFVIIIGKADPYIIQIATIN